MPGPFAMFTLILLATGGYYAVYAAQRWLRHQPLLPDEDYIRASDGSISAPDAFFDVRTHQLIIKGQAIPFSQIKSVYLQGMPSRRINIGVILQDETWIDISRVRNNEVNRAVINAALITEALAQQSERFKAAAQAHNWRDVLLGQSFVYPLG